LTFDITRRIVHPVTTLRHTS